MERTTGLLYKIARDLCASHWRKVESRKKYETHLSFGCNTEGLDPEHAMELKELKTLYEKTLSRLPEHQREVFLMSRMEDLTYKEIAVRLGVTVKAVEKRMQIALQVLRKAMAYG